MTHGIRNLWPEDLSVKVRAPIAILRAQREPLRQATEGLLQAEVLVTTSETDTLLSFDVFSPALNYRRRLFIVTHQKQVPYPCVLTTNLKTERLYPEISEKDWKRRFLFADEFEEGLAGLLQSPEVRSVLESMLALINEENANEDEGESGQ